MKLLAHEYFTNFEEEKYAYSRLASQETPLPIWNLNGQRPCWGSVFALSRLRGMQRFYVRPPLTLGSSESFFHSYCPTRVVVTFLTSPVAAAHFHRRRLQSEASPVVSEPAVSKLTVICMHYEMTTTTPMH
ncbi:hypothetical protein L798_15233 [Zootermopsis nevadensis]|uniref:Uncharacterized protein n=1 Tax=Zootermopsis nevadensis TaxID=136037 RepID=A0A067RH59_ZOONE|nr:hypothetical protein L798_15233 [Zootermopsis nevadensis]